MKTVQGFDLKLLIDTGANKNYLSPQLVKKATKLPFPSVVKNISGKHFIENFVEFNPFPNATKSKFVFHVFKFHDFFDGLIGYETLQELGAIIDTKNNTLNIAGISYKMYRKYPEIISKEIPSQTILNIEIPVSIDNGDFLIESDYKILPNLIICAGLYRAHENKAFITIENLSKSPQLFSLDFPFEVELNNFEQYEINDELNSLDTITISNRYRKLVEQLRLNHLNSEEKTKLMKIIEEYQPTFYIEGESLSNTTEIKHTIYTKDDFPVYQKSYRYPHCHKEEVSNQIQKMLTEGIIRPSNSPWNSPIWVVPKKRDASGQQKWRIVVDYRKLNAKTVDDKFPIPNITDILDKLGRSTYFTTLDLASGFHQIEMLKKIYLKQPFQLMADITNM